MPLHTGIRILLAVSLFSGLARGAFEWAPSGPRALALASACSVPGNGPYACFGNPACLVESPDLAAGFFYQPGLFGMSELAAVGGGVSARFADFGFAFAGTSFGFDLYRETQFTIAAGHDVMWGVSAGMRLRLNILSIAHYGSSAVFTCDVGVRLVCSDNICFVGEFTNLTAAALRANGEQLPQQLRCGILYTPAKSVRLLCSAGKDNIFPLETRFGVEYDIAEPFTLRLGVVDNPSIVTAGCAIRVSGISFDYACAYHWILGPTHELGVSLTVP
jgi:hypothetical protein